MHRSSIQRILILVSLCSCSSADGARDGAVDQAVAPVAGTGATMSTPAAGAGVSFETSVQPFINMACNCHQSAPLMAPFSLKKGEAYKAIVNVPSSQVPTMMLVTPGSLEQSYLWHKVNGTFKDVGGTGMIMPSTIPLNATEKQIFENWIAAGAPP